MILLSASVNIKFLNEQNGGIRPLHLTIFAINNHYLRNIFQPLYQLFK